MSRRRPAKKALRLVTSNDESEPAPRRGANPGRARSVPDDPLSPDNAELIERFLAARASGVSDRTLDSYRSDLRDFARTLEARSLLGVETEVISLYFNEQLGRNAPEGAWRRWGFRTGHRHRSALRSFYRWAVKERLCPANPAAETELRRFDRPSPVEIHRMHINKLLEYIEAQIGSDRTRPKQRDLYILDRVLVRLMYLLALRVSEASNIDRRAIRSYTLPSGQEELRATIVRKGDRTRSYPITGAILAAYKDWLDVRDRIRPIPLPVADHPRYDKRLWGDRYRDRLFVHPWTGRPITRRRAWTRLRLLARRAGIPADVIGKLSPHKLRHARARQILDDGGTITDVQAVLGHSSVLTTSVYLDPTEETRLQLLRSQADVESAIDLA